MRISIAEETRQEVVTKWLSGWARDKIAGEIGIGAGTVTNIIAQWTNEVGTPTAAALRELSIEIRRTGMGVRECARGLRITRVLSSKMTDDEVSGLELFVDKVYNKCKYLNISPDRLVELASEIWELSKNMPVSQISSYLDEKIREKETLEAKINELNMKREITVIEYNRSLDVAKIRTQELQEFIAVRQYFSKYCLGVNDLHRLTTALLTAEEYRYDIHQIVQSISSNKSLAAEEQDLQRRVLQAHEELKSTQRDKEILLVDMDQKAAKIKYCIDLESMGFGINEFIALKCILVEIAETKNTDSLVTYPTDVVKLLFRKFEELRNVETKVALLREEASRTEELCKSYMDGMKEFMGDMKKDVKEVSDLAIKAIKMAQEGKGNIDLHDNKMDIT